MQRLGRSRIVSPEMTLHVPPEDQAGRGRDDTPSPGCFHLPVRFLLDRLPCAQKLARTWIGLGSLQSLQGGPAFERLPIFPLHASSVIDAKAFLADFKLELLRQISVH